MMNKEEKNAKIRKMVKKGAGAYVQYWPEAWQQVLLKV